MAHHNHPSSGWCSGRCVFFIVCLSLRRKWSQATERKEVGWDFGHGAFHKLGVWGGGFGDMDEDVGDGGPACNKAIQLPFFNPMIKGFGKNSFRVIDVGAEITSTKFSEGNAQPDVDIVLRRMRDRKRRRRIREVPAPPPNSLRSLRRYVLTKKMLGEGRKKAILKGNGGVNWGVDGWGMV